MNKILNMNINDMNNVSFQCSCGKTHHLDISCIQIGKNVISELPSILRDFKNKKIYILSDNNTWKAAGEKVYHLLKGNHFEVISTMIDRGKNILIPDEKAVGEMFMGLPVDTGMIVSVGSGTLNDMAKYMSSRTKIPYTIVCTAPSMDGYASSGAPLMNGGRKISYNATLPYAIVGDTEIMKHAPMKMILAGYGDIIGKLTALADWKLSHEITGEYYCETIVNLVQKAVDKVVNTRFDLANRDDDAICYLIEALILTGVAMGLIGVSRPASGAEHMLSHYWEMAVIASGKNPELHGIKVGIATPIIARIFDEMKDQLPESVTDMAPSAQYVTQLLKDVNAPVLPKDAEIDKDLFYHSILEGNTVRERYSILDYAVKYGDIRKIAEELTNSFF